MASFSGLIEREYNIEPSPITKDWFITRCPQLVDVLTAAYFIFFGIICVFWRRILDAPVWDPEENSVAEWVLEWLHYLNNKGLTLANVLLSAMMIKQILDSNYNLLCEHRTSQEPDDQQVAGLMFFYFLIKIAEWSDHGILLLMDVVAGPLWEWLPLIIHHSFLVILSWYSLKYYPTGTPVVLAAFNTVAHAFAYFYLVLRNFEYIEDPGKIQVLHKMVFYANLVQLFTIAILCIVADLESCGLPGAPLRLLATFVFILCLFNIKRLYK